VPNSIDSRSRRTVLGRLNSWDNDDSLGQLMYALGLEIHVHNSDHTYENLYRGLIGSKPLDRKTQQYLNAAIDDTANRITAAVHRLSRAVELSEYITKMRDSE